FSLSVHAQTNAAEPKVGALPEQPATSGTANPAWIEPPPLPEPSVPIDRTETKAKKSKTSEAADALRERIHFREIKTRALNDERVQAEFDHARAAKTDSERREALRQFYAALYSRMLKLDASLKAQI